MTTPDDDLQELALQLDKWHAQIKNVQAGGLYDDGQRVKLRRRIERLDRKYEAGRRKIENLRGAAMEGKQALSKDTEQNWEGIRRLLDSIRTPGVPLRLAARERR